MKAETVVLFSLLGLGWCYAETLTVTTAEDQLDEPAGEELSLREALRDSMSGDDIDFDHSLAGARIPLELGELVVDKFVFICGLSAVGNEIDRVTIDAQQASRVFRIEPGAEAFLAYLILTGGLSEGPAAEGGGILALGTVVLEGCELSNNRTGPGEAGTGNSGAGGAGGNGAGLSVRQEALAVLVRSQVIDNACGGGGRGASGANGANGERGGLGGSGGHGGGIHNEGTLIIEDSIFSRNSAGNGGGGGNSARIAFSGGQGGIGGQGGAIFNMGSLEISRSEFNDNSGGQGGFGGRGGPSGKFVEGGGGGFGGGGGDGGAIDSVANATLEGCYFHGNLAGTGGTGGTGGAGGIGISGGRGGSGGSGGDGGGISNRSSGTLVVRGSTLTTNQSGTGGSPGTGDPFHATSLSPGLGGAGAGISQRGTGGLTVVNSTFYRNSAGGFCDPVHSLGQPANWYGGAIYCSQATSILNSTITENDARSGGGIYATDSISQFDLANTIVAQNSSCLPGVSEIRGTPTSDNGHNFTSGDPLLSVLGDNGGSTPTMLPLPGSPVIDAGMDTPDTFVDQREYLRSLTTYDIGAIEFHGAVDASAAWHSDLDGDGRIFGIERALGSDPSTPEISPAEPIAYTTDAEGNHIITFDLGANPLEGTKWIVKRSTDLMNYTEIYRFDGTSETHAEGVSSVRGEGQIQVIDPAFVTDRLFYIFESPLP